MTEYWLISAPGDKTCQQTFETMNNVTSKQNNLCENVKFHIPDLKVGTLDQLVGLSDDLGKLDAYVEQVCRKLSAYLGEVLEDNRDKLQENLLANNSTDTSMDDNGPQFTPTETNKSSSSFGDSSCSSIYLQDLQHESCDNSNKKICNNDTTTTTNKTNNTTNSLEQEELTHVIISSNEQIPEVMSETSDVWPTEKQNNNQRNRILSRRSSPVSSCCGSSQGRSSPSYVPSPTLAKVPLNFDCELSGCDESMSDNNIDEACNNKSTVIKQPPQQLQLLQEHHHPETLHKRRKTSAKRKRKTEEDFSRLGISSADLATYITRFQWDMAKYPTKQSLRNIADIISKQTGQIEADLKTKSAAYNSLKGNLQNLEKKQTGSLLTRNLADLVKKEHFILDSEYLTTLLVIVPRANINDWQVNYEKITDMIVPRSSQFITQDQDYALFNVTLFKKVTEEFKLHAREKKFIVREFTYNEEELAAGKNEITKLVTDKKKQFGPLVRWLKVNFSEAFCAWIHLKALRVFVESVLRYGLPVNFQAILIHPNKKSIKRLRDVLNQLYGHLDGSAAGSAGMSDNVDIPGLGFGQNEYYAYVFYKLNVDMIDTKAL